MPFGASALPISGAAKNIRRGLQAPGPDFQSFCWHSKLQYGLTCTAIKQRFAYESKRSCPPCSSHTHSCQAGLGLSRPLLLSLSKQLVHFFSRACWVWAQAKPPKHFLHTASGSGALHRLVWLVWQRGLMGAEELGDSKSHDVPMCCW